MIHIHPHYVEPEIIDHRSTIAKNWATDMYGFVTPDFAVESMFRYGTNAFHDVLTTKRNYVSICKFPDEVALVEEDEE